jgi:hypothetical protein
MEALQVLKFSLKKSRPTVAPFNIHEYPSTYDGPVSASSLMAMLKLKPDALKAFLDTANLVY